LDDFGGEKMSAWPFVVLSWFAVARARGVPTVLLSVGAGPMSTRRGRLIARSIIRLASYQSYRDEPSHRFVLGLGASPDSVRTAPDLVFGLNVGAQAHPPAVRRVSRKVVVVAVMDYRGWQPSDPQAAKIRTQLISDLTEISRWLIERGYHIRLLVADDHDLAARDDVAHCVLSGENGADPTSLSLATTHSLLDVIHHMDDAFAVVAIRFHSLVAALIKGIPPISLSYAEKNDDLQRRVGLEDFSQDIETVDLELLQQQFKDLEERHDELARSIAFEVEEMRIELRAQSKDVSGVLTAMARMQRNTHVMPQSRGSTFRGIDRRDRGIERPPSQPAGSDPRGRSDGSAEVPAAPFAVT
jgi:polysaccharide pyruvyl transferase WcaK-like protein